MRLSPRLQKNLWWWEPAYILDWSIVVGLFFLTSLFVEPSKPFERDFDLTDKSIAHKYAKEQRVPDSLLHFLTFYLPIFLTTLHGAARGSTHHIHHAALALASSCSVTHLVNTFLKNHVGRLRPDFLERCKWDAILLSCSGKESVVWDGRRSFPSGHSSQSFAGLGIFALYLAGQLHLTRPSQSRDILSSLSLRLLITFSPLAVAAIIALSRIEDYRHFPTDVLAGSLLGSIVALISYTVYWPNPLLRPLPISPSNKSYDLPPPVSTASPSAAQTKPKDQWTDSARPRLLYRPSTYPSAPSIPLSSSGTNAAGARQRTEAARQREGAPEEQEVFVIHDAGDEMDREGLSARSANEGTK